MKSDKTGKLILRLAIGGIILFHGIAKLSGIPGIENLVQGQGLPAILAYGVYLGELVAPLMLIIGYRSRIAGLIVAINMLVAIKLVHMGDLLTLTSHGGWGIELQALYLFGALAIFCLGGGRLAVSHSNKWD